MDFLKAVHVIRYPYSKVLMVWFIDNQEESYNDIINWEFMLYLISRFRKEMEINVHDCYNWIDKYQSLNLVTILKCLLSIPSMRCILYQTNVLMHAWRMNSEVYLFVVMEINGLKLTMSQTSKHEDNLWWFVKTCD